MARRFEEFCQHIAPCFRTKTRDGSQYGWAYLQGQLRLETKRTFTGLAQGQHLSVQNLQHFMSNSPWSAAAALELIQHDLQAIPELQHGGVLILDEMADEKAGEHSAGSACQYNGRLHRVAMSQVGVYAAYAHVEHQVWTWVDAEL